MIWCQYSFVHSVHVLLSFEFTVDKATANCPFPSIPTKQVYFYSVSQLHELYFDPNCTQAFTFDPRNGTDMHKQHQNIF